MSGSVTPRRRRIRVPLPADVPIRFRLSAPLADRLAWWLASQGGWSPGWWH